MKEIQNSFFLNIFYSPHESRILPPPVKHPSRLLSKPEEVIGLLPPLLLFFFFSQEHHSGPPEAQEVISSLLYVVLFVHKVLHQHCPLSKANKFSVITTVQVLEKRMCAKTN